MRRRRVMLAGGLVAFGVHKMSKKDADRIEQHTGVPPEELEDDELEQAMSELNIESQPVGTGEVEAPGGGTPDPLDELKRLGELRDAGILTEEEFEAQKRKILGT